VSVPFYGGHLVDATAVEKVEVTRLHFDLTLFNLVFCGVFVIGTIREMGLNLRTPNAPVHDSLGTVPFVDGILYTDKAGELVRKTGDREVEELVAYGNMIDVGDVFVTSVVDAKDSGAIEASIGFTGDLDLLVHS
jgi:hypothetical protein